MDPISNEMKMNVFELIGRLVLSTENYKKNFLHLCVLDIKRQKFEKKRKEK